MRTVRDIPVVENIPILVRTALNVPIRTGVVTNDYRLRRDVPTISYLAARGARVVVISHIGEQGTETLAPVATALGKLIPNVSFCPETLGARAREAIRTLSPGHVLVLENLRRDTREINNDRGYARELAALADVFVQDSFDTCHRPHASIIGVPQYIPSYAGLLLEEEVRELSRALSPAHPAFAVIGGAKFSTKEPVLRTLLARYDSVFAGGALANDFLQVSGAPVGKSLVSGADADHIRQLLADKNMLVPVDSRVVDISTRDTPGAYATSRITPNEQVGTSDVILDHGPGTTALLAEHARTARTILWNGPLGMCEDGFTDTTNAFARAVAESSAYSLIGGGDTIAAVEALGLLAHFSFVSTGGGAMLDFLAKGTLPGIDALGH